MNPARKISVLAVDDSRTMLAMIASQLKDSDFEVVATASSGAEAVEKFRQHKPQLVLLDVVMPEVSGVETLERLLHADTAARVIMISSAGTENAVRACLEKGAKSFLQKPIRRDGMIAAMKNVCHDTGVEL